jgi:hypothetical protein
MHRTEIQRTTFLGDVGCYAVYEDTEAERPCT